jgi:Mn2+/Fe2+ NRAMP family transporter
MLTTAVTLHAAGKTDIQTEQAAEALKPIAGEAAFLFSLGLIGTGPPPCRCWPARWPAAVSEVRGWRTGLEQPPRRARPFYFVIALAIVLSIAVDFVALDPIKALIWSAVVNGVIVVPILVARMVMASRIKLMGDFTASRWQVVFGWAATAVMAAAAIAMFVLM